MIAKRVALVATFIAALISVDSLRDRSLLVRADPPPQPPASKTETPKTVNQLYHVMIEMLASPDVPVSDKYEIGDLLSRCEDEYALFVWAEFLDDKRIVDPEGEHPSGDPYKSEPLLLSSVCKGLIDTMLGRIPREPWPIKDYPAWLKAHKDMGLLEMRAEIKRWRDEQKGR